MFAAMAMCWQNQKERLVVGLSTTIHLRIYAVAIIYIQNHLVLTAAQVGACIAVHTLMECP